MAKKKSYNRSIQIVNRIRITMAFVYVGMVSLLAPTFTSKMLAVQSVAIGVYIITAVLFWVLFARGKLSIEGARRFVVLDTLMMFGSFLGDVLMDPIAAALILRSAVAMGLFIVPITYSSFLNSKKITLIVTLLASTLYGSLIYFAQFSGLEVKVIDEPGSTEIQIVNHAMQAVVILAIGIISYLVMGVMEELLNRISVTMKDIRESNRSKESNRKQIANSTEGLQYTLMEFSSYLDESATMMQDQSSAVEQISAVTEELSASAGRTLKSAVEQEKNINRLNEWR